MCRNHRASPSSVDEPEKRLSVPERVHRCRAAVSPTIPPDRHSTADAVSTRDNFLLSVETRPKTTAWQTYSDFAAAYRSSHCLQNGRSSNLHPTLSNCPTQ